MKNLDNIDLTIIGALEKNARLSFSELGETVQLSKTPSWNRVNHLQKRGVIHGYSAQIDPNQIGLTIRALVHIVIQFGEHQAFEKAIIEHRNVRSCHAVTGEFDYVLEILARDIEHFDELLRTQMSELPGVMRFNTSISTRMIKQASPYTDMLQGPNNT